MTTQEIAKETEVATPKAEEKNYAFAEDETTIHVALGAPSITDGQKFWPVESKVLLPGDYISLDELPEYLQDSIKAKKTSTLKLVTLEEAEALKSERERILSLLGDQVSGSTRVPTEE